jgi:bacterioferritin
MKGDKLIISHLNQALKKELTAINQYFLHSRLYENWGITKLARFEYKESIEEMQHADALIKRILFLEGHPNLQDIDKLHIGETVEECIKGDLKIEIAGRDHYVQAVADADSVKDYVSKELFLTILKEEEAHIDHLETMLESIKLQGLQNFIQLQTDAVGEGEK